MTTEDKAWVLKQLEKFGSVKTPTPLAPLRRETTNETMSSKEKQMVKKLQGFGDKNNRYSLPSEMKAENSR